MAPFLFAAAAIAACGAPASSAAPAAAPAVTAAVQTEEIALEISALI